MARITFVNHVTCVSLPTATSLFPEEWHVVRVLSFVIRRSLLTMLWTSTGQTNRLPLTLLTGTLRVI